MMWRGEERGGEERRGEERRGEERRGEERVSRDGYLRSVCVCMCSMYNEREGQRE